MVGRWPFVGRTGELEHAASLIASGVGVLIFGAAGIGKTAFARRVEERVATPAAPIGRIVGHAVSNTVPFEAFAGVLTNADAAEPSPVDVAHRVSAELGCSTGTKALFLVDDAHLLDERSAQVLLQLAADRVAIVIATGRRRDLPDGIDRLWREDWCERIELAGLSDNEVVQLIETALDAPVESAATQAFADRAQGNPLLLPR